jgi:hypothetical protein
VVDRRERSSHHRALQSKQILIRPRVELSSGAEMRRFFGTKSENQCARRKQKPWH